MRIDLPQDQRDNPIVHLASAYARQIVSAGVAFSKATYQHSRLSLREFEGARARTAEINGCTICQQWRSARDLPGYFSAFGGNSSQSIAARGPVPDELFYQSVSQWRTAPIFSPRERIAIEYAERLGTDPQGLAGDDSFWTRAKSLLSDEEIVDLSYCVACWMGLGRVTHALGMDAVCSLGPAAEVA
jgi:alkylhydroperoxidase family enzyme